MPNPKLRILALSLLLSLATVSCGQKGALKDPDAPKTNLNFGAGK